MTRIVVKKSNNRLLQKSETKIFDLEIFMKNLFKLCYVYVKFKRTNESSSPLKISQSINFEWRSCDRNGKQFFQ